MSRFGIIIIKLHGCKVLVLSNFRDPHNSARNLLNWGKHCLAWCLIRGTSAHPSRESWSSQSISTEDIYKTFHSVLNKDCCLIRGTSATPPGHHGRATFFTPVIQRILCIIVQQPNILNIDLFHKEDLTKTKNCVFSKDSAQPLQRILVITAAIFFNGGSLQNWRLSLCI